MENNDRVTVLEGNMIRVQSNLDHIKDSVDKIGEAVSDMSRVLNELANLHIKQSYLENVINETKQTTTDVKFATEAVSKDYLVFKTKISSSVLAFVTILTMLQGIAGFIIKEKLDKISEIEIAQRVSSERIIRIETLNNQEKTKEKS